MSLRRKLNNIQIEEDSVEMAGGGGVKQRKRKRQSHGEKQHRSRKSISTMVTGPQRKMTGHHL